MRQAVGDEWTMDSPTGWVVGEGEDERKVKVHSTSTDSRPVPSHASAQRPQASPGGGGQQGSSPLPRLPRGVLGGWAALITGRFHWQRTLEPNGATERFSAASGPCCECDSLFRDHEKEEGQQKPTDKRSQGIGIAYRHQRGVKSVRHPLVPASSRRPSDSFDAGFVCSFSRRAAPCRQPTSLPAGATLPFDIRRTDIEQGQLQLQMSLSITESSLVFVCWVCLSPWYPDS